MSIALSDSQIDQILFVSRPLRPAERSEFMGALFEALIMRRDELGDGALHRTLRDLQQKHFQPPTDAEAGMLGTRWTLTQPRTVGLIRLGRAGRASP